MRDHSRQILLIIESEVQYFTRTKELMAKLTMLFANLLINSKAKGVAAVYSCFDFLNIRLSVSF